MKELTSKDTKMLQGLSVLAMVCLHLFDTWDYADKFIPILYWGGVPISFYIAQLSDFCVFGFAFCSGYGHYAQSDKKDYFKNRLKSLLSLLCIYWMILFIFSVISIIVGQSDFMPGSIQKFVLNFLTLENSYNGATWYVFIYILIVVISPIILKVIKQYNSIIVLLGGFIIYFIAYYLRFNYVSGGYMTGMLGKFGMTLFEYMIGAVCCKIKIMSWLYTVWKKQGKFAHWILTSMLLVALLYVRTRIIPSLFVAPISGAIVMILFHFWDKPHFIKNMFSFVGRHSTNIWLIHMYFYLQPFKGFVFIAKYPPLIFLLMMLITIVFSIILQFIEKPLQQRIADI